MDLIIQLPLDQDGKSDSIAIYIDHSSGQVHLVNTDAIVTAEGIADMCCKNIFHLHSFFKKVYSDHSFQFIACFMKALYECLGIKTSFTSVLSLE